MKSSHRILIVDDEADVMTVMKRGLEMSGFHVRTESDPATALENFKAGTFDLLITDIKMPKMDGFELAGRLLEIDPKIRICFITAFDIDYFEKFRQRFSHIPTRCFIKKPVSIANLVGMVRQELGHS
jgi:CheY-like chemotaxis protein